MQEFKDYIIDEYRNLASGFVGVEFKFSHTSGTKLDKKTEVYVRQDVIRVNVKFYNKDIQLLLSRSLQFDNNVLPKSVSNKLVNISPDELNNRFLKARDEICSEIMKEYQLSETEIKEKIEELNKYCGGSINTVTPPEFKGESITPVEVPTKKKQKNFDM